jgi:hypothetical protein
MQYITSFIKNAKEKLEEATTANPSTNGSNPVIAL